MEIILIIVIAIVAALSVFQLLNILLDGGYLKRLGQWRRLRRRGRSSLDGQSLRLSLALWWPRLMCSTGRHLYSKQMRYLKKLEPGHVLTCERWFCAEFSDGRTPRA